MKKCRNEILASAGAMTALGIRPGEMVNCPTGPDKGHAKHLTSVIAFHSPLLAIIESDCEKCN